MKLLPRQWFVFTVLVVTLGYFAFSYFGPSGTEVIGNGPPQSTSSYEMGQSLTPFLIFFAIILFGCLGLWLNRTILLWTSILLLVMLSLISFSIVFVWPSLIMLVIGAFTWKSTI